MVWRSCVVAWAGACVCLGASPAASLAGDPVLVATDATFGSPMVYHLDPASGQVLLAEPLTGTGTLGPTPLSALSFGSDGRLLGFTPNTDNMLYSISRETGVATRVGRLQLTAREGGLATFADGTVYGASTGSPARLFSVNPSTGRATAGAAIDIATDISGLGARADGLLVGLDLRNVEAPPALRLIDPETGETALLAALLPRIELADVGGLEVIDRDGTETGYYIVTGSGAGSMAQLWRFDPYTGVQEPVGVIPGVGQVTGLAGLPCDACAVDLDGDCEATIFDFLLLGNWFDTGDIRADIDGNGVLDLFDFLLFLNLFDQGC
ncbi:MAG: GC-type dockerin domain-anchored protein [Phycisphaerales bacterium JB064]